MKNVTRHIGKLEIIKRLKNSINGNPRFEIAVLDDAGTGFTCITKIDCSYAYVIDSFNGQKIRAYIGTHYGKPTLDSFSIEKA